MTRCARGRCAGVGAAEKIRGFVNARFARFAASSLISTLVDQVLAFLLFRWLRPLFVDFDFARIFVATFIARVCSVALNYTINLKRVFNKADIAGAEADTATAPGDGDAAPAPQAPDETFQERSMKESLPRFLILAAFVLLLSSIGVYIGHAILGFNESLSKIVVDLSLFFVNYHFQRTWVFVRRKNPGAGDGFQQGR